MNILTNLNNCDILLSDGKEADFSFKSKAQSRFRKPNRFLSINRNVPFLLEEYMLHDLEKHKPVIKKSKKGNIIYICMEVNIKNKKYKYARLLIENYLNKKLTPNEVVHHINRNTLDNRISNLQIMTKSKHNSLHSSGKNNAMYGKRSPNWKRIKINCLFCGKEIYKKAYSIKLYKKHFCSNKCARKYNNKTPIKCPVCKKITLKFPSEVKRNRRFCSLSCAYNYKKSNPNLYYTDISNRQRDKFGRLIKYIKN